MKLPFIIIFIPLESHPITYSNDSRNKLISWQSTVYKTWQGQANKSDRSKMLDTVNNVPKEDNFRSKKSSTATNIMNVGYSFLETSNAPQ